MAKKTDLEQRLTEDSAAFVEALAAETGVSPEFLERARPAIDLIFTDVPEAGRALCIETVREIVESQASTEADLRRLRVSAGRLLEQEARMRTRLEAVSRQVRRLAADVAGAQMSLYQLPQRSRLIH